MPDVNDNTVTEFTPSALATITAMRDELARAEFNLGADNPLVVKAAVSLARSLSTMLTLRPTKVMGDGPRSLICHSGHLTFGVNYTGTRSNEHGIGEWSVNS